MNMLILLAARILAEPDPAEPGTHPGLKKPKNPASRGAGPFKTV